MTDGCSIPILVNKNVIDGVFTLTIYGYFLVWLLVLVSGLG